MSWRERNRSDLRQFLAILGFFVFGCACLALGLFSIRWDIANPEPDWAPSRYQGAPIGVAIAGAIFVGCAIAALIRRLRDGPDEPGGHTRE